MLQYIKSAINLGQNNGMTMKLAKMQYLSNTLYCKLLLGVHMTHGITTSIRLPPILRGQLEKASRTLHRGKNWIIAQALEEYLSKLNQLSLAEEARRQSLLASQTTQQEDQGWEENSDTSDWI